MQLKRYVQTLNDFTIYDTYKSRTFKEKYSNQKWNISIDNNCFVFISKETKEIVKIITCDYLKGLCSRDYLYLNRENKSINYEVTNYNTDCIHEIYRKVGKDYICIYSKEKEND